MGKVLDERAAPDGEGLAEAGGGVEQAGLARGVGGPGFPLEGEGFPAALAEEGLERRGGHAVDRSTAGMRATQRENCGWGGLCLFVPQAARILRAG